MQVKVGDIAACCPQCGGVDFVASRWATGEDAGLACKACGEEASRSELLIQIGDKAARQAAESLARLKRERARNSKKP